MSTANYLDQLAAELIPFILKNLSIQDLKNCCSIDNIWKDETLAERMGVCVSESVIGGRGAVVTISLPNIFESELDPSLGKSYEIFEEFQMIFEGSYKCEYDLVLGIGWLMRLADGRIDGSHIRWWKNGSNRWWKNNEEKR
ncbi:2485_t:CDS:2 [Rhizophagus irregularis]|nr:2485_t:CDS:2 [Rhizophagus irregularis]